MYFHILQLKIEFVAFTDGYIGYLTNAIVTYSDEMLALLKACTTTGNCLRYLEGSEEEWLGELLKSGSNHVCDIFSDNCM